MTPDRWNKIKEILHPALEMEADARAAFLRESCREDHGLMSEIEELLNADNTHAAMLECDPSAIFLTEEGSNQMIGRRIGNYEITGELGSGGMGSVYLAKRADGQFEQTVALKLIKRGMDSEAILKRFVTERQILASLEHPNIARMITGGTTDDGSPYFVMEQVEGMTLTEYAESENLSLKQRLDLFREVCSAVSYAHSKLVIHRDLKPSNILITNDGKPKLLDFGIAKILNTDVGDQTLTRSAAFTPDYASPEQICGEELSTATDIYSLGIILYELLTGLRPFRFAGKNLGEIVSTATKNEPPLPSTISTGNHQIEPEKKARLSNLKGDLDNIILKALKKEPSRRYLTVNQLSEDIRRHLTGLPVVARRDTWHYRAGKFTRRNPLFVGAVALAFLILVGGMLATLYQARQANIEREKAERRFNDVRSLAHSFIFEINREIAKSPIRARELLVQRAIEYLDKLTAESSGNIELKSELAAAYEEIGEVQSDIFRPYTGKTSESHLSHQKALQLREEIFARDPSLLHGMDVASSRTNIGNLFLTSGNITNAVENYREAIRILEAQLVLEPKNTDVQNRLASSYSMLGQAIVRSGSLTEALENYTKSLALYRDLTAVAARFQRSVGIVTSYIAFVELEMGRTDDAAANYANWLEITKRVVESDPTNILFRNDLSTAHTCFGIVLSEQGNIPLAKAHFLEGLKIQRAIFEADKENLGEEYILADVYLEYGKAMARNHIADESIINLEKALTTYRRIWQKDPENLMTRHRIANAQRFLADAFFQSSDLDKARENYEQAHIVFKELTEADPNNIDWQQDLAMSYMRRGEFAMKRNDKATALTNFELALPIFEKLTINSPENRKRKGELDTIKRLLVDSKS